jgi:RNA polymerase sigma-70 factor (ECF subfamily)
MHEPSRDRAAAGCIASLYEQYGGELHTYAARLLGSRDGADDVTQEVFLRAVQRWQQQDLPLAARPWLYRVATNRCRDLLRRRRLIAWLPLTAWREDGAAADPVGNAVADADVVQRVLATLAPRDAALVVLWGAQGLGYREIAVILQLSPGAASAAISRAHARFARRYAQLTKEARP